jgi:DNA-binding transcriptional regulator GbsR (MarR family)
MSRTDFPKIYNPATQTASELIENFVVRTELFHEIFEDIKNSEMKNPEQHYIIQGIRGQGKTTLLLRIAYEIEQDEELRKRFIPIVFNEEQYNISRLFKLWETIAGYLEEMGEIKGLYNEMQKFIDNADFEERCFQILEKALIKHHKKMILFIDNIDELLTKFSKREHQRLREVFQESAEMRIIGASSVSLEFHYDYGKPFYQFFRMPQLRGLNTDESKTLLLKLGEYYKTERVKEIVANQPGRIEALRRMTGGVIRTIILLYEIFVDDTNGNAFLDLEKILDSVTPLYKHRMDKLSPQQQEIIDFIALSWDAVSTKEIAQKTKLESKAVSSQLKQLEKYHIVEKEKTNTKNYMYRIHERFFNIWYLMRLGRKWDVRRVRFLIEFLQIWCDETELEQRAGRHLEAIKQSKLNDQHALLMTEALARTPLKREMQHELISKTRTYLDNEHSELAAYLCKSDNELIKASEQAYESGDFETAIRHIEQIKIKTPDDYNALGVLSIKFKNDFKQAEKYYLQAVGKDHAGAMNSLAWSYFEKKINKQKALEYAGLSFKKEKNIFNSHTYSMVLLWDNQIKKAYDIALEYLNNQKAFEKFPEDINLFLLLLIAKKQYQLTLKLFNENLHNLKDRYKPIYYALMHFMQDEYPNEYRRMGGELKQTVEEIIGRIHQLEKDYE